MSGEQAGRGRRADDGRGRLRRLGRLASTPRAAAYGVAASAIAVLAVIGVQGGYAAQDIVRIDGVAAESLGADCSPGSCRLRWRLAAPSGPVTFDRIVLADLGLGAPPDDPTLVTVQVDGEEFDLPDPTVQQNLDRRRSIVPVDRIIDGAVEVTAEIAMPALCADLEPQTAVAELFVSSGSVSDQRAPAPIDLTCG